MEDKKYIADLYNHLGGEQALGGTIDKFESKVQDPKYAQELFNHLGGEESLGGGYDKFYDRLKKKEQSVPTAPKSGSGSEVSQNIDTILQNSEAVKQASAPSSEPKDFIKPVEPPKEDQSQYQIQGLAPDLEKTVRTQNREYAENMFLTLEEKEDASILRSMIKSGVDPKNPTPRFQEILNERYAGIDQEIEALNKTRGNDEKWNASIDKNIQKLQKRKEFFFGTPEEKITNAIVATGNTPKEGDKYSQLTKIVEDKTFELRELYKEKENWYKEHPFVTALAGGLHGMGVIEDKKRDRMIQLQNELKDIVPLVLTAKDPELEEDDFSSSFMQSVKPDVMASSTSQEKAVNVANAVNQIGLKLDPKDAAIVNQVADSDIPFSATLGTAAGESVKMAAELAVGGEILEAAKVFKTSADVLSKLKYGKQALEIARKSAVIKDALKSGVQYQTAGTIFQDENLDFTSGVAGGVGMGLFQKVSKPLLSMVPKDVKAGFLAEIGKKAANMTGSGVGEVVEESSQQLSQYIKEAIADGSINKIGEYIHRDFKDLSDAGKFIASTFILGAAGGAAINPSEKVDFESLPENEIKILNDVAKEAIEAQELEELTSLDMEGFEGIYNSIKEAKDNGIITPESADVLANSAKTIATANERIPQDLDLKTKAKAQLLIIEKMGKEAETKGAEPALVKGKLQEIKDIDAQLELLVNPNAESDQVVETNEKVKQPTTKEQYAGKTTAEVTQMAMNPSEPTDQETVQVPDNNRASIAQATPNILEEVKTLFPEDLNQEVTVDDYSKLSEKLTELGLDPNEYIPVNSKPQTFNDVEKMISDKIAFTDEVQSIEDIDKLDLNDDTLLGKSINFLDKLASDIDKGMEGTLGMNAVPALTSAFLKALSKSLKLTRNFAQSIAEVYANFSKTPEYSNLSNEEKVQFEQEVNNIKPKRKAQKEAKIKQGDTNVDDLLSKYESMSPQERADAQSEFDKVKIKSKIGTTVSSIKKETNKKMATKDKMDLAGYIRTQNKAIKDFKKDREGLNKIAYKFLRANNLTPSITNINSITNAVMSAEVNSSEGLDKLNSVLDVVYQNAQKTTFFENRSKLKKMLKGGTVVSNIKTDYKKYVLDLSKMNPINQSNDFAIKYNELVTKLLGTKTFDPKVIDALYNDVKDLQAQAKDPVIANFKDIKAVNAFIDNISARIEDVLGSEIKNYDDLKKYGRLNSENNYAKLAEKIGIAKEKLMELQQEGLISAEEVDDAYNRMDRVLEKLRSGIENVDYVQDEFEKRRFVEAKVLLNSLDRNLFTKEELESIKPLFEVQRGAIAKMNALEAEDFFLAAEQVANGAINKHVYDTAIVVGSMQNQLRIEDLLTKIKPKLQSEKARKWIEELALTLQINNLQAFDSLLGTSKELDRPFVELTKRLLQNSAKQEVETNRVLSEVYDSYNKLSRSNEVISKFAGGGGKMLYANGKRMKMFRTIVGMLLTQARYEANPVLTEDGMVDFKDLPQEMKDKFRFLYENKVTDKETADESLKILGTSMAEYKEAWDSLIKDENGNVDLKANMDLLMGNKETKKFVESVRSAFANTVEKARVVAHSKGHDFNAEGDSYFAANTISDAARIKKDSFVEGNVFTMLSNNISPLLTTPGAAQAISRGVFFTDLDVLRVVTDHVQDVNQYYYISSPLKSILSSFKRNNAALEKEAIGSTPEERNDIEIKVKMNEMLAKRITERANMQYAKIAKKKDIVDYLAKGVRAYALANPVRLPSDFSANMVKALSEMNASDRAEYLNGDWSYLMEYTGSSLMLKYDKNRETINSADQGRLEKIAQDMISWADVPTARFFYINAFRSNYKKLTGLDFDIEEYMLNQRNGSGFKYKEAIQKASDYATVATSEVMNSQDSFSQATHTRLVPFVDSTIVSRDTKSAKSLNLMMSYGMNDTAQLMIKTSDLINDTNEGRAFAAKRLTGILASNATYGIMSKFFPSLITAAILSGDSDEDKNAFITAVVDTQSELGGILLGNAISLGSGRYSWLLKDATPPILWATNAWYNNQIRDTKALMEAGFITEEKGREAIETYTTRQNLLVTTGFEGFKAQPIDFTKGVFNGINSILQVVPLIAPHIRESLKAIKEGTDVYDKSEKIEGKLIQGDEISQKDLNEYQMAKKEFVWQTIFAFNMLTSIPLKTPIQGTIKTAIAEARRNVPTKKINEVLGEYDKKKMTPEQIENFKALLEKYKDTKLFTPGQLSKELRTLRKRQSVFYKENELDQLFDASFLDE
jgi:hypothetical protein